VAAINEYEAVYERLRGRMVASVRRRGVHENDVEDVVQDALEKLLNERIRPGAPPVEARAYASLEDKRIEHLRRESRRLPRVATLTLPADVAGRELERPEMASADSAFQMFELRATIEAIAGPDAMRYALLNACGATEDDIAICWAGHRREQLPRGSSSVGRRRRLQKQPSTPSTERRGLVASAADLRACRRRRCAFGG
jgi:hypothetical protein